MEPVEGLAPPRRFLSHVYKTCPVAAEAHRQKMVQAVTVAVTGIVRLRAGCPSTVASLALKLVRPEVVATSPCPIKSRVLVYCSIERMNSVIDA